MQYPRLMGETVLLYEYMVYSDDNSGDEMFHEYHVAYKDGLFLLFCREWGRKNFQEIERWHLIGVLETVIQVYIRVNKLIQAECRKDLKMPESCQLPYTESELDRILASAFPEYCKGGNTK